MNWNIIYEHRFNCHSEMAGIKICYSNIDQ